MKKLLIGLLLLSGCSPSAAPAAKTYICLNPFISLQGILVETDNPNVKEKKDILELSTQNGETLKMPKHLCAEIVKEK